MPKARCWRTGRPARRDAQAKIADYSIAATNESVVVGTLSGGNQQKIIVARELDRGCRMLIAAQPTRGVDIASADYIQGRILAAAEPGLRRAAHFQRSG